MERESTATLPNKKKNSTIDSLTHSRKTLKILVTNIFLKNICLLY